MVTAGTVTAGISDKVPRPSILGRFGGGLDYVEVSGKGFEREVSVPCCRDELPASNEEWGISGISTSNSAVGSATVSTKEIWSCGVSVVS